jgi:hypothetical protein
MCRNIVTPWTSCSMTQNTCLNCQTVLNLPSIEGSEWCIFNSWGDPINLQNYEVWICKKWGMSVFCIICLMLSCFLWLVIYPTEDIPVHGNHVSQAWFSTVSFAPTYLTENSDSCNHCSQNVTHTKGMTHMHYYTEWLQMIWFHKANDQKVIAIQKLNTHHCKGQLEKVFVPYRSSALCQTFCSTGKIWRGRGSDL